MDIQKEVLRLIAEHMNIPVEKIQPESELIKDLKADSLDIVEIVMSLEDKFKLKIPDQEAEKMHSVNSFITYIKNKKSS